MARKRGKWENPGAVGTGGCGPGAWGARGRPLALTGVEIETSAGRARVKVQEPAGQRAFLLVLTHGSGGTPDSADVLAVRDAGLALGAVTALVTQPYVVRGARAPGPADKQDAAWAQIVAALA